MQWTQDIAQKKLDDMNMGDMPLIRLRPQPASVSANWFVDYKKTCRKFAESLTDSIETLSLMNLSQDEFRNLLMGQKMPQNLSIRFRVPLQWGGKIEIDNLFMCWTFPLSNNLDRFIIEQSGNEEIWLPNPATKIYLPIYTTNVGDGGNATEDRLAQISAQLANKRGRE